MNKKFTSLINLLRKNFLAFLVIFLASLSLLIVKPSTALAADDLIFYEGNSCTQDIVFSYDSTVSIDENCQSSGSECYGDNDEARSLKILGFVNSETRVEVYDHPEADSTDDFAVIDITDPNFNEFCVETFEKSIDDNGVEVYVAYKNGLDGKVSNVKVIP
ncbi:MAG: hypothetical protein F6J90_26315 [Moorea sp. SIOASIH]|uniref:hypothetical protein n=1 Tax=Moorena sp. SIOASIH TaxID=2607817 RepID=UPI0013BE607D|nr:hypothetical protein [Moorena sp. SIOASIH]NEO39655.1 hypothetical protein [Moorena sp. SIOASIH]